LSWLGGQGEVLNETIRIESGVVAGNAVTPFYDPMVAKVVAWGETREVATARLAEILATSTIEPLVTNMNFVRAVLATPEWAESRYDTKFAETFAKRK
jgi:3-methylcrotonyl-CoA carboxylase alpha subunit